MPTDPSRTPSSPEPLDPGVLVLEVGRCTWFAAGDVAGRDLDLDETLDLLAASAAAPADERSPARVNASSTNDTPVLDAGVPLAGLIEDGAVAVYADAEHRWVRLGPDHLRVLAHATAGLEPDRLAAVVADLVGLGVAVSTEASPETAPQDAPADLVAEPAAPAVASSGGATPGAAPHRMPELRVGALIRSPLKLLERVGAGRAHRTALDATPDPAPDVEIGDIGDIADIATPVTPAPDPDATTELLVPRDGRVPVYTFWATDDGPPLGAAAVVAYARVHDGGSLNDTFEFHQMMSADAVLAELAMVDGPAVLLCGNYDWSLAANLDVCARARRICDRAVFVHGGPSTPRDPDDCNEFLRGAEGAHVAVMGEGEITFAEMLAALARELPRSGTLDLAALEGVTGLGYLDPGSGCFTHWGARDRHDDLSDFPSPLLSGELDLVPEESLHIIAIETNRGCPYSCTFCDWGAATMSRIRKFPIERVRGELEWLASRHVDTWFIADANFGILARDVEIADIIADLRGRTGFPNLVVAFPAKNSTERYLEIMDRFISSGIALKAALALQTRDEATLAAVHRSNIKTESYDRLASESRRRGLPLLTELMIGLPGSTVESFKNDLQWSLDRQIRAFMYPTVILPNAPMNEARHREELAIRTVDGRVVSTSSFTEADRRHMDRIAAAYNCFEVFGSLRHVLRYLQWDHDRRAADVVQSIADVVHDDPRRYPLLAFHLAHFDDVLVPPVGWRPMIDEALGLLNSELGVADDSGLRTAAAVTEHLLPRLNRRYPDEIELPHDYVAYFTSSQGPLALSGEPGRPDAPLRDHGPGVLEVTADPLHVVDCFGRWDDATDPFQQAQDYEPRSPIAVYHSTRSVYA